MNVCLSTNDQRRNDKYQNFKRKNDTRQGDKPKKKPQKRQMSKVTIAEVCCFQCFSLPTLDTSEECCLQRLSSLTCMCRSDVSW